MRFEGKVAVVTGGARGIGKAISLVLAKEGADIVIFDLNDQEMQKTASEIEKMNVKTAYFSTNVTDSVQVQNNVNKVLDKFNKIDILINNAGITKDNLLLRMSEEEWDIVLSVNLKGAFNCTKAVLRPMLKQRTGKIVNVASIIGIMGNIGQANYAASKGGLIAFTKSAAKEVASRNINVNAIAPGFIETDMTAKLPDDIRQLMLKQIPLARFGKPEDVANLVLFLCSEDSNYITGHVIQIDGGMVM